MCLRCGVVEYPYWSWPSGPAGPGDYGSPPDASPPEYGAAPTGGVLRDRRPGSRLSDDHGPVGPGPRRRGTSSPGCASSASQPRGTRCVPAERERTGAGRAGLPRPWLGRPESTIGER